MKEAERQRIHTLSLWFHLQKVQNLKKQNDHLFRDANKIVKLQRKANYHKPVDNGYWQWLPPRYRAGEEWGVVQMIQEWLTGAPEVWIWKSGLWWCRCSCLPSYSLNCTSVCHKQFCVCISKFKKFQFVTASQSWAQMISMLSERQGETACLTFQKGHWSLEEM